MDYSALQTDDSTFKWTIPLYKRTIPHYKCTIPTYKWTIPLYKRAIPRSNGPFRVQTDHSGLHIDRSVVEQNDSRYN